MNDLFCKPLIVKELRQTLLLSAIGAVAIGLLCWVSIPTKVYDGQSAAVRFTVTVGVGCAVVALVLGLFQGITDKSPARRGFLLHRPVSLRAIFVAKLVGGLVSYGIAVGVPIALTAMRLAVIGPERLPTGPADLLPLAVASLVIFVLHPAAFWASNRSARILGTRGLPIVFAGAGAFFSIVILLQGSGWWVVFGFASVTLISYAITVSAAWHVFAHQAFLPPRSSNESMSASRAIGLFLASLILLTTAVSILLIVFPVQNRTIEYYTIELDQTGNVWEIQNRVRVVENRSANEIDRSGRQLAFGTSNPEQMEPLPEDWKAAPGFSFSSDRTGKWYEGFQYLGNSVGVLDANDFSTLVGHEGRILVYSNNGGVKKIVTPDGVFGPGQNQGGRFGTITPLYGGVDGRRLNLESTFTIATQAGIYQIDLIGDVVRKIVDAPVNAAFLQLPSNLGDSAIVWVVAANRLLRYSAKPSAPDEQLDSANDPIVQKTFSYPVPMLTTEKIGEYAFDHDNEFSFYHVSLIDEAGFAFSSNSQFGGSRKIQVINTASEIVESGVFSFRQSDPSLAYETCFFPPALTAIYWGVTHWTQTNQDMNSVGWGRLGSPVLLVVASIHSVLAAVLAFWVSGTRLVPRRTRVLWSVLGAVFGLFSIPAIFAIHAKVFFEPCSNCDQPRPIDTPKCPSCGAGWEQPESEGIEIISRKSSSPSMSLEMPSA